MASVQTTDRFALLRKARQAEAKRKTYIAEKQAVVPAVAAPPKRRRQAASTADKSGELGIEAQDDEGGDPLLEECQRRIHSFEQSCYRLRLLE